MKAPFGPVVLAGLVTSGTAALAGTRVWVDIPPEAEQHSLVTLGAPVGEVPLAGGLGLVALACWGVLLVTRGRVRRAVALLGAAAAAGVVAAGTVGLLDVADEARRTLRERGFTDPEVSANMWGPLTVVAGVLAVLVLLLAWRAAPAWPEMGRKYDAPAGSSGAATPARPGPAVEDLGAVTDTSNLDLWKQLDDGLDPTAEGEPDPRPRDARSPRSGRDTVPEQDPD